MTKIKVINRSSFTLPQYETALAAGMDIKANIAQEITLGSLERVMIPTGLYVEIPEGYEIQIRPRSGMAAKFGVSVLNSPGTIDPDYRGEIRVILVNLSKEEYVVKPGERVAQMVVAQFERIEWQQADELSQTDRGEGGFGHSGK